MPRRSGFVAAALAVALPAARLAAGQVPAPASVSPYAGEQARPIKALSPDEIESYRSGAGMGLAKAAELNHYPGPRHVLDLGAQLGLTEGQRAAIQGSFERMQREARALGASLVDEEAALDAAFASGSITSADLDARLARISELQSRIRGAHLRAHLETRGVLGDEQVRHYDSLRGYATGGDHQGH
ncbi:MAG: Spy/CpxP family protein refolding chaperone [Vicinamibacteria bacterium]